MGVMPRRLFPTALASSCALALALPAAASANIAEIGKLDANVKPGCPDRPCFAVSRTTGYQAKVGTSRGLMAASGNGRIVAWSIALGNPGTKQIEFFNSRLGGESEAQITILDPRKKLRSRVVSSSPAVKLAPYFGQTVQFPLVRSLRIRKGQVVALTTKTWAPALQTALGNDTSWRASREKGQCEDTQAQTAQTEGGSTAQYYCLYRTARLTYDAVMVTDPVSTKKLKKG